MANGHTTIITTTTTKNNIYLRVIISRYRLCLTESMIILESGMNTSRNMISKGLRMLSDILINPVLSCGRNHCRIGQNQQPANQPTNTKSQFRSVVRLLAITTILIYLIISSIQTLRN